MRASAAPTRTMTSERLRLRLEAIACDISVSGCSSSSLPTAGRILAPRLELDVSLGEDLGLELEQPGSVALECRLIHGAESNRYHARAARGRSRRPQPATLDGRPQDPRRRTARRLDAPLSPREGGGDGKRSSAPASARCGASARIYSSRSRRATAPWALVAPRLTGKWLRRRSDEEEPRFARFQIELDDRSFLYYVDTRIFGRLRLVPAAAFDDIPSCRRWGPIRHRRDRCARAARQAPAHRQTDQVVIMDQALLPGVGNIQAIEALHRAAIDPRRAASSLSQREVDHLRKGLLDSFAFTLASFASEGSDGGSADITTSKSAAAAIRS